MSRKTNISKKPVIRSYGIQSYRAGDKKDYSEIIGTPTFFAANAAFVVRESEFARPYKAEDYGEMEYAAPLWPGFDWPGVDFPGMGLPVPDFPEMYDPWEMKFYCSVDPCWCEGETIMFLGGCTYEIVDAYFAPSESALSVTFTKNSISITAIDGIDSVESGYLTIVMKAYVPKGGTKWQGKYDPVIGTHSSKSVSECTGNECESCDDSGIAWDRATSAETVAQENSCTVAITDSLGIGGPYAWAVSGTGFTLDNAETEGLTNTLNADNTACGSATITVTGCGNTVVTGYVRCTTGTWVWKGNIVGLTGLSDTGPDGERWYEKTLDNKRQKQRIADSVYSAAYHNCTDYTVCADNCGNYGFDGTMGLTMPSVLPGENLPDPMTFPPCECQDDVWCCDLGGNPYGFYCYYTRGLYYHEWECAP